MEPVPAACSTQENNSNAMITGERWHTPDLSVYVEW